MDLILQGGILQACITRHPVVRHDAAHFNDSGVYKLRDRPRYCFETGVVHFLLLLHDHTDVRS